VARKRVRLPAKYKPTSKEKFMTPVMKEYFRRKLETWKQDILSETDATLEKLKDDTGQEPDLADRAAVEAERSVQLRTRDRARKLIAKIDAALGRIEDGSYGYCEETADPISIRRLEARPIATLSLEAQERHERHERTHRDD
jgi:DnaK suppressor protein